VHPLSSPRFVRAGLGVADLNIGVLFFLAVSALEIVGLFMGGWGSNNKYALLSAMRAVNQISSYDLPSSSRRWCRGAGGSLQLSVIVEAQRAMYGASSSTRAGQLGSWPSWWPPCRRDRGAFDILEASRSWGGLPREYSGMKFALIQLGEYAQ